MGSLPIGIVTVNYGDSAHSAALARSLAALDGIDQCRILVVNNGATTDTAERLARALEPVRRQTRIIHLEENRYYWGAAAYAIADEWPDPAAMPRWIIVCNNDILLPDAGFVPKLLALNPVEYGVIAPSIISAASGRDQNPFLRRPWGPVERLKWRVYYSHYVVAHLLLVGYRLRRAAGRLRDRLIPTASRAAVRHEESIFAPHGAFMIFSRTYFARGGALDASVPMYAEEITVGEIARRIGVRVVYYPALTVIHQEHATVGHRLTRAQYRMERLAHRHFYDAYWKPHASAL